VTVDLDHGVVHVDQRILEVRTPRIRRNHRTEPTSQSRQREQEPAGYRVELAHVPKRECTQERAQRRRRVSAGKDPDHPAVPQQRHVVDRVRPGWGYLPLAGAHPRDQRRDL
jgi:hypothetical protein